MNNYQPTPPPFTAQVADASYVSRVMKRVYLKMFFAMLKSWSQAKLAKLLWFITGSSQLPVDGFAGLKKSGLVIQIERALRPNRVPEAHTCFAILDLPEYTTVDLMEQMFSLALDMCNE